MGCTVRLTPEELQASESEVMANARLRGFVPYWLGLRREPEHESAQIDGKPDAEGKLTLALPDYSPAFHQSELDPESS